MAIVGVVFVLSSCQAPVTSAPVPSQLTPQPLTPPTAASPPTSVQPVSPTITAQVVPINRDKPIIIEFTKAFNTLNKDWEGYRRSYGDWRQKVACAEPSMTESLSKFVSSFQKIKRTVNDLPQTTLVRSVSERLAEAAEREDAALIDLRTNWKPGDEAAFQKYEAGRLAADRVRRQAEQTLSTLMLSTQAENIDAIDKYRRGRSAIEVDWDAMQKDYDSWRQSPPKDSKVTNADKEKTAMDTLQKLATNAQGILNRAYTLTSPTLIRRPADLLVEAAEREEAALRKLKTTWKLGDEDSLATYERERLAVNKLRRDSAVEVGGITEASLQGNKSLLQQFSTSYGQAGKAWGDFHSQYDDWRNKGGDCDRNTVRQQLSERLDTFHTMAQRVNALPQTAVVRPLAELMTQAAEREEAALRQLKDNWKPYDSNYYQNYEKEWAAIDRLRRQAAAGLTDLMQKSSISASEVGP